MSVTFETSQDDRSWLKAVAPRNISDMSVTCDTSQVPIGPFGPFGQSPSGDCCKHELTALLSVDRVFGVNVAPKRIGLNEKTICV